MLPGLVKEFRRERSFSHSGGVRFNNPDDIIEVISAIELRKELGLNDKDRVTVEVSYD
jgi:hypothetical protein